MEDELGNHPKGVPSPGLMAYQGCQCIHNQESYLGSRLKEGDWKWPPLGWFPEGIWMYARLQAPLWVQIQDVSFS